VRDKILTALAIIIVIVGWLGVLIGTAVLLLMYG
jgi:hypothetical protein